MNESLSEVVAQALEQAPALWDLDGPRAEAWASDLVALAADSDIASIPIDGYDSVSALLRSLDAARSPAGAIAAASVRSVLAIHAPESVESVTDPVDDADFDLPDWVDSLGTSVCDGAWIFTNRRNKSAVFRFVDSADASHTVAVDLVSGSPESIGEVVVGPADVVALAEEPESDIESTPADPAALAARVADAFVATSRPRETFVVNAQVLVTRLSSLVERELVVPRMPEEHVPDVPEHDPDDDAFALSVLTRALGPNSVDRGTASESCDACEGAVARAAALLRQAAENDDREAQWLAASRGPVDLDDTDLHVVVAALVACIRPHQMEPLDADARDAVAGLEWADWLGVVIGLVREGDGASAKPSHLVDLINRCPEVTSTIPKVDRAQVEWSLAVCTELWDAIGVATENCLTLFGVWILPQVLAAAWGPTR